MNFNLNILVYLIVVFFLYASNVLGQKDSLNVVYQSIAIKKGKLKDAPYDIVNRPYAFEKNDSIKVFSYTQNNYYVEINGNRGYIHETYYFNESEQLKSYKAKILELEKDSIEVFKARKQEYDLVYNEQQKTHCQYRRDDKDPISGNTVKITDWYEIAEIYDYKLNLLIKRDGGLRTVHFKLDLDLGCSSPYSNNRSKVEIRLENNDLIKFYHSGDIDCGDFYLIGKLSLGEVNRLKKSKIKFIRLTGTEGYQDFEEEINFKEVFINKLKCIE